MTLICAIASAQDDAAPAAAPLKPRPALIVPLAAKTITLGVTQAGSHLVAVGARGHILLSDDGKAWKQVASPVDAMLNRVRFRDDKVGWAVGHDAAILGTADGGQTWTLQHFASGGRALYDVIALDGERVVAVGGYGTYLASADNGKTWEARTFPVSELGQHFSAIVRLADGTLLIAGERGLLVRSADSGENWDLLDSPYSGSFFGVLPAGEHGAIAFGLRGNIYASDDVGKAPKADPAGYDAFTRETVTDAARLAKLGWRLIKAPTTESLFGGTADGATLVLVGVNGTTVRVDAAKNTAVELDTPALETLNDIHRFGDRWIAVGRRGPTSF
jgi:photosystem II stability/assembly factor-like uncharacterized protein